MLLDGPAGRENDEISNGRPVTFTRTSQHGENARVLQEKPNLLELQEGERHKKAYVHSDRS